MPLRLRLARVPPQNQKPWLHLARHCTPNPALLVAAIALLPPLSLRRAEGRRSYVTASAPRQRDGRPDSAKPSIFAELFPDQAHATHDERVLDGKKRSDTASSTLGSDTVPEEVRRWLQSESEAEGASVGEQDSGPGGGSLRSSTSKTKRPEPTVLVLSGTTASLLPSDFFRIAPKVYSSASEQVDGWAATNGGIYKIVQDRDPVALTPRGRYFLYFGSSAAALAYAQEVRDLHTLARRAVQPPQLSQNKARRRHKRRREDQEFRGELGIGSAATDDGESAFASLSGTISGGGSGVGSDTYLVSSANREEMAALHSFTLLPPTAQLDLVMQMPASSGRASTSALTLYDEEELDDVAAINATTKVLVALHDTSTSGGNGSTMTDGNGSDSTGVLTVEDLRGLIDEDGVRRNLPWAVSDGLNGVVPVQWLVVEQKRLLHAAIKASKTRQSATKLSKQSVEEPAARDAVGLSQQPPPPIALWASRVPDLFAKTEHMNENGRFSRFVVAFSDAVEARRFVRSWHRRAVSVPGTDNHTAIVETTVLW